MRSINLLTFLAGALCSVDLSAQTRIAADPERWTPHNSAVTFEDGTIHLTNTLNKTALLWMNNVNFKNGTIELDIKGKDVGGQSFVGVAFHGADDDTYDAVYFRPFNFRNQERKDRAVQYIDKPDNDWNVLREKYPGKYEHAISPDTDPNDWFHVKIMVRYPVIKVYVNESATPTLEVKQISKRQGGKCGLWVDSKDGWFKNVTIANNGAR